MPARDRARQDGAAADLAHRLVAAAHPPRQPAGEQDAGCAAELHRRRPIPFVGRWLYSIACHSSGRLKPFGPAWIDGDTENEDEGDWPGGLERRGQDHAADPANPVSHAEGLRVSAIKHAHHGFDVDVPGKDSWVHREAGATEVLVSSANRFALMHELRGAPEPGLPELLARMARVDLVIIEGFSARRIARSRCFAPTMTSRCCSRTIPASSASPTDRRRSKPRCRRPHLDDIAAVATMLLSAASNRAMATITLDLTGLKCPPVRPYEPKGGLRPLLHR